MNRNEEYRQLLQELDALEAPKDCVARAMRRERRRKYLLRPVISAAAVFVLFVALVNLSSPVAYACSRVPGLRELAQAVTFSRSLTDAVDNDYVQPINLSETNGDITVKVEYLIVDQRSVTVFYRIESECYPHLEVDPIVHSADGTAPAPCSYGPNEWDVPNGELRSLTINFPYQDVPDALQLVFNLYDPNHRQDEAPEPISGSGWADPVYDPEYVADFTFLLEFDPYFTAQGKHFTFDEPLVLGDQTLHITGVDVYPSYLNLTVVGDDNNSAWLRSLKFYLVTDRGERFDPVSNGVVATGSLDTPEIISYRADSTFFYKAKSITLYAISAEWLDKAHQTIHIDLNNAHADTMPQGSSLYSCRREDGRWIVTVLERSDAAQTFMQDYFDAEGNRYEIHSWTSGQYALDGVTAPEGFSYGSIALNDYPYDEVWLTPRYTELWSAEQPVSVTLKLDQTVSHAK